MRVFLKYSAGLIALYLGVAYASGSGKLITSASKGSVGVIRAFQGR